MLAGNIDPLGSHYVINLNAMNCQNGDSIATEQIEASQKEEVLNSLGKAATGLRRKLGESLGSVQKFDAPIEQATTPSLEALKALSQAMVLRSKGGDAAAIPLPETNWYTKSAVTDGGSVSGEPEKYCQRFRPCDNRNR